jgi:Tfp pilus assembly protein FimV
MVCLAAVSLAARRRLTAALIVLSALAGVAGSVYAQSHQGARQYSVRSGDTLDRIISQQMGSSPYSIVFLRDTLARLNPHALPQGARGVLLAGAVLQIPDACMLQQAALGGSGACAGNPVTTAGEPRSAPLSAAERMEIERRSWVRYP